MAQKLVIIGGGNSSAIMACLGKLAGYHTTVLTRKPEKWSATLGFKNEDAGYLPDAEYSATVDSITSDPATCIPEADVIFIAGLPIHLNPVVLQNIKPHINREKEFLIGTICAYGGFNWVCAQELGPGKYHIFGTQCIPWCCGTVEYGKTGVVFGAKRFIRIATEDGKDGVGAKDAMGRILQIKDVRDTDFLACTLWPNNPWIHPPILYGVFKDWDGKSPYSGKGMGKAVPDFIYKDLRPGSVECLEVLNKELVELVAALSPLYPEDPHLQENYNLDYCIQENYLEQVTDKSSMGSTFMTCAAYAKHHIPYTTVEGGVVPTLAHKFFETDLPFGLCTYKDMAIMVGVETPLMDKIIIWNQGLIGKEYLNQATGKMDGAHANECILPSALGLTKTTLLRGCRE
jgi:hypothetical protein